MADLDFLLGQMEGTMGYQLGAAAAIQRRREQFNELILKAIETKEPVLIGVWGPTGQSIYITVESREGSGG